MRAKPPVSAQSIKALPEPLISLSLMISSMRVVMTFLTSLAEPPIFLQALGKG